MTSLTDRVCDERRRKAILFPNHDFAYSIHLWFFSLLLNSAIITFLDNSQNKMMLISACRLSVITLKHPRCVLTITVHFIIRDQHVPFMDIWARRHVCAEIPQGWGSRCRFWRRPPGISHAVSETPVRSSWRTLQLFFFSCRSPDNFPVYKLAN